MAPGVHSTWLARGTSALVAAAFLVLLQRGAASPHRPPRPLRDAAWLAVSFSWVTRPVAPCRQPTAEELARDRPDVAKSLAITGICPRQRRPAVLQLLIDGRPAAARAYAPRGLRRDGRVTGAERWPVAPGRHTVTVRLQEVGSGTIGERTETRLFRPGTVWILDLAYPDPRWRGWP